MEVIPEQLPQDLVTCHQLIAQLLDSMRSLQRQNEQLTHRLQQLLRARFGQKAEKIDSAQLMLFAQQILAESQTPDPPTPPPGEAVAKKGHGRKKLPRNLPRLHNSPVGEHLSDPPLGQPGYQVTITAIPPPVPA